jgi:malonyl-CoA/methylmalonyl-CoA synthetase
MSFSKLVLSRNPNDPFILGDDGRDFTYGTFWQLAGKLALALGQAGAKPGDRVAVQVEKSVEAVALFFACVRGGFVFLPLNTAYMPAEISYFVSDAEPAVFVSVPGKSSPQGPKHFTLNDAGGGSLMDLAKVCDGVMVDHGSGPETLSAILYTSGTTGKSKGAMLSQGNLLSNAMALVSAWRFTASDRLIHALPVYHTHGLFVATNTVLASGASMFFRRKFDAADMISLLPKSTLLMGVPTFYTRLLARPEFSREVCQNMRLFVSGSAPLLAETHREFSARTGHAILERYGMTETNMNTSNPYEGERRPGSVGQALPGIDVRVVDGMIEVKGPNVTKGYWRNEEKTKASFTADGYFITGDLGSYDEDGYLVISGRASDLIITGGFNVYPKEIEEQIDAMEGVVESAVVGLPHADFGEAVTAVVVLQTGVKLEAESIIQKLRQNLAAFKTPKAVYFVDEMPRNAMGKVQKKLLREQLGKSL